MAQQISQLDCPNCGCPESKLFRVKKWGRSHARRTCDHCGNDFAAAVNQRTPLRLLGRVVDKVLAFVWQRRETMRLDEWTRRGRRP